MDSDTSELWRALGGDDFFTLHILCLLMSRIQHPARTDRNSAEDMVALGPLAATCASLEMFTTIHSSPSPVLRELVPEILCAFLEQRQLQAVGNPCRLSMGTLACVISKGLGERVAAKRELGHSLRALRHTMRGCASWPAEKTPELHPRDLSHTSTHRPFFNHDDDNLHSVAFALFDALVSCIKRRRQAYFRSQVRQSLAALLFHLQDPNLQVAKECRTTLSLCCPYLGLRRVQATLTFHVQGPEQVKQEQLLWDLCRHLDETVT
ncbi:hypothetical protein Y1Q_0019454 [Alligator mississippiensis]|uniref:Maestro/Maestro-like HEAT-repeats domain-containing protein n=1 Tax=Alligator mississippiensis TaxID=8496 RepID=A0A151NME8_ALLMI|nr:hypothetical protein Y1Q_0019454 [Alligator mississippiensis]